MPAKTDSPQKQPSRLQPLQPALICFGLGSLLIVAGSLLAFQGIDKSYFTMKAGFGLQMLSFALLILNMGKLKR